MIVIAIAPDINIAASSETYSWAKYINGYAPAKVPIVSSSIQRSNRGTDADWTTIPTSRPKITTLIGPSHVSSPRRSIGAIPNTSMRTGRPNSSRE